MTENCNFDQELNPQISFPNIVWRTDLLIPAPVLLEPRPNAVMCLDSTEFGPSNIVLRWLPSSGATVYLVQWGNNPQLSGPTVREFVTTNTFYELVRGVDVRLGEKIYWRVQAANLSSGGVSPKSEIRALTYNCPQSTFENLQQATGCAAFDVNLKILGRDWMPCDSDATFWLQASFSSKDNVGRDILCIAGIDWSITQDPNGDVGAAISKIEHNGFKIKLKTESGPTQVIQLKVDVTFKDLITGECFICNDTKDVLVDCDTIHRPLLKFKLEESLPQCSNSAAVEIVEDAPLDPAEPGQRCDCDEFNQGFLTGSSSSSGEDDCCKTGRQVIVHDALGLAKTSGSNGIKYAPRGNIGYAVWRCKRWEVLAIGEGCCETSSSSSDDGCEDLLVFRESRYTYLEKCLRIEQRIVSVRFEDGCITKFETDWFPIKDVAGCECCVSGDDCCDLTLYICICGQEKQVSVDNGAAVFDLSECCENCDEAQLTVNFICEGGIISVFSEYTCNDENGTTEITGINWNNFCNNPESQSGSVQIDDCVLDVLVSTSPISCGGECPECVEFREDLSGKENPHVFQLDGDSNFDPVLSWRYTQLNGNYESPWCPNEIRRFEFTLKFESLGNSAITALGVINAVTNEFPDCPGIGQALRNFFIGFRFQNLAYRGRPIIVRDCQYPIVANSPGTGTLNLPFVFPTDISPVFDGRRSILIAVPATCLTVGDEISFWIDLEAPSTEVGSDSFTDNVSFTVSIDPTGRSPVQEVASDLAVVYWCVPGKCCVGEDCFFITESQCNDLNGTWQPNVNCSLPCPSNPPPTGACCINGVCSIRTQAECTSLGGTWAGAGTDCTNFPCEI